MEYHSNNPNIRCSRCNGREIIYKLSKEDKVFFGDRELVSSLREIPDGFVCVDEQECRQNIDAENTLVEMKYEDGKLQETRTLFYGKEIFKVRVTPGEGK